MQTEGMIFLHQLAWTEAIGVRTIDKRDGMSIYVAKSDNSVLLNLVIYFAQLFSAKEVDGKITFKGNIAAHSSYCVIEKVFLSRNCLEVKTVVTRSIVRCGTQKIWQGYREMKVYQ